MPREIVPSQVADLPHEMTTTGFDFPGYRITESLGVVRGVVVRSRGALGTMAGVLHTIVGGNITAFTSLAERARSQAFDTMLHQAHDSGANAVIGIRYDANDIMNGVTEVICYGTAVWVESGEE